MILKKLFVFSLSLAADFIIEEDIKKVELKVEPEITTENKIESEKSKSIVENSFSSRKHSDTLQVNLQPFITKALYGNSIGAKIFLRSSIIKYQNKEEFWGMNFFINQDLWLGNLGKDFLEKKKDKDFDELIGFRVGFGRRESNNFLFHSQAYKKIFFRNFSYGFESYFCLPLRVSLEFNFLRHSVYENWDLGFNLRIWNNEQSLLNLLFGLTGILNVNNFKLQLDSGVIIDSTSMEKGTFFLSIAPIFEVLKTNNRKKIIFGKEKKNIDILF